jgi:hypothetical protein
MGLLISIFENYIFPPVIIDGQVEFFKCFEKEETLAEIFFDCYQIVEHPVVLNFLPQTTIINGETTIVRPSNRSWILKRKLTRFFSKFKQT